MIRQCCICKRMLVSSELVTSAYRVYGDVDNQWCRPILKDESQPSKISHTYCPACVEKSEKELAAQRLTDQARRIEDEFAERENLQ